MKAPAIRLIRAYQTRISPHRAPSCRFAPTCSEYGAEAIARYGLVRGGIKTVWRLIRCNPFNRGGYDPPVADQDNVASLGAAPLASRKGHGARP